jgi:hypothetical protein
MLFVLIILEFPPPFNDLNAELRKLIAEWYALFGSYPPPTSLERK